MATPSIVGQAISESTDSTVLVSGPCVMSTLFICNTTASSKTFSVQVRKDGEETSPTTDQQYIYKAVPLAANETAAITSGISLGTGQTMVVTASATGVAFTAFGVTP